jgi:hypothetical protein
VDSSWYNLRDSSLRSPCTTNPLYERGRVIINPLYERKAYKRRNKSRDYRLVHEFILLEDNDAKESVVCLLNGSLALHAHPFSLNEDMQQATIIEGFSFH